MARTTAPLFSMDASGTVAGAIVFSRWRGRSYVRRHAIPANPRSPLQVGVRSVFRWITQGWRDESPTVHGLWNAVGDVTRTTGLNAWVAENVRRLREGRPWRYVPGDVGDQAIDSPTSLAITALSSALQLDWTEPANDAYVWGQVVHMLAGGPVTPSIANLIMCLGKDVHQLIVTGLTPGTVYYFSVNSFGTNNLNGATPITDSETPNP